MGARIEPEILWIMKVSALPSPLVRNHAQHTSTNRFIPQKESESASGYSSGDMCACAYACMCGGNMTETKEKKQEATSKELLQVDGESDPMSFS